MTEIIIEALVAVFIVGLLLYVIKDKFKNLEGKLKEIEDMGKAVTALEIRATETEKDIKELKSTDEKLTELITEMQKLVANVDKHLALLAQELNHTTQRSLR